MTEEKICCGCDKPVAKYSNWCEDGFTCMIASAKREGGKTIAPNNLPITCIKFDSTMMEHEHADHPDYIFPIKVELFGHDGVRVEKEAIYGVGEDGVEKIVDWHPYGTETHAVIYTDSCIVVTMYECQYYMWHIGSNVLMFNHHVSEGKWRLTEESLKKIKALGKHRWE